MFGKHRTGAVAQPFTYQNLKIAIDKQLDIDSKQLAEALATTSDLAEIQALIKTNASAKIKMLFAEYLLQRATATKTAVKETDKLNDGLWLIDLIQFSVTASDNWKRFGEQAKYQALIQDLLRYRSLKEEKLQTPEEAKETQKALHLIIKEGMRCNNIGAFENFIRYQYLHEHGYTEGAAAARKACLQFAKLRQDKFANEIYSVLIALAKKKPLQTKKSDAETTEKKASSVPSLEAKEADKQINSEMNFIACLSKLCQNKYSLLNTDPNKFTDDINTLMGPYGLEMVTDVVMGLDYAPLKFLLAKYHAEAAIKNYESAHPDTKIYSMHIDQAERLFKALSDHCLLTKYVGEYRFNNKKYGDVFFGLSSSRLLSSDKKLEYLSKGVECNHTPCIEGLIEHYAGRGETALALEKLEKLVRGMPFHEVEILTNNIRHSPHIPQEIKARALALQKTVQTAMQDTDVIPALDYATVVSQFGGYDLQWRDQSLHVEGPGMNSCYFAVTKEPAEPDAGQAMEKYDAYKLYVSFDPTKTENFLQCWSLSAKHVLPDDNIHGFKMMSPHLASDFFAADGTVKDKRVQPGKMCVIYFKPYHEMKKIRGSRYTQDDYYHENFLSIKKFEQLYQAHLTPGAKQAVPESGIRAKSRDFAGDTASLVFISGKEHDDRGRYIDAEKRTKNEEATNPYTNPAILRWEQQSKPQKGPKR